MEQVKILLSGDETKPLLEFKFIVLTWNNYFVADHTQPHSIFTILSHMRSLTPSPSSAIHSLTPLPSSSPMRSLELTASPPSSPMRILMITPSSTGPKH